MFGRFDPTAKKTIQVLGARMSYVEHGKGRPIVLLHGNPTSSYLWRKVIPELGDSGHCIAPDLIGMGDSEKIGGLYRFKDHAEYLEAFLGVVGATEDVVLVLHDWGGPLGFDWARRNPSAVAGVVYMETIVTPMTWEDWPEAAAGIFRGMRSEAGEDIVLGKNVFVERILPASVLSPISDKDMNVYRKPYLTPGESRRPTLTWPRELPIDGQPEDVLAAVEANQEFMSGAEVPKLFINADPGSILIGRQREVCRAWENQVEVTVDGIHFIQEDSGREIGQAMATWLNEL